MRPPNCNQAGIGSRLFPPLIETFGDRLRQESRVCVQGRELMVVESGNIHMTFTWKCFSIRNGAPFHLDQGLPCATCYQSSSSSSWPFYPLHSLDGVVVGESDSETIANGPEDPGNSGVKRPRKGRENGRENVKGV